MALTITINKSAAFGSNSAQERSEIARVLSVISAQISTGHGGGSATRFVRDNLGNLAGYSFSSDWDSYNAASTGTDIS